MGLEGFIALFIVGIVIAIVIAIWAIMIYNTLVRMKNNIKKSWANIDVLLKQRTDEIPKLVDSVKGYMKYEENLLLKLTEARTKFLDAKTMHEKADADNMISGTLKSIFAVAENYPDLKASESFLQLQQRISTIENQLSDRREYYNDSVNEYNIKIQSIPDRFVANALGYVRPEEMFQVSEADKQDVKIKFD